MRLLLIPVFTLGLLAPAAALADQPRRQPEVQRVLYVCDTAPETRRAFQREHGQVIYMSAEEVLAAEATSTRWTAPRCISPMEARRLAELRSARASR